MAEINITSNFPTNFNEKTNMNETSKENHLPLNISITDREITTQADLSETVQSNELQMFGHLSLNNETSKQSLKKIDTFTENANMNEKSAESDTDSKEFEFTENFEKYDDIATEHNSEESDSALDCASVYSDSTLSASSPESSSNTVEDFSLMNVLEYSDNDDYSSSVEYEKKDDSPILITGGAGFIGSHVANALLRRGEEVVIVDEINNYYDVNIKYENLNLLKQKFSGDKLRIYQGDICDNDFIEEVFRVEKPTRIIHLAARAGVRPSIEDPFIYIHSNIKATTILLELARRYSCTSFVYASSSSVYGDSDKTEFSETDNVDFPSSPYAATKKACELMAYTYHHLYGLNCAGLRFFTVYGPRGRPDMAPFKFIDRISRGLPIQQFGDGSSSRDYTYIDDIVDGVIRSLDRPQGYQIYNLGNGNPIELKRFIEIVEKYVGKKAIIEQLPNQPGDVPRTCANVSKAQKLLGYYPKTDFEKGIKLTVQWYQEFYSRN